MFCMLAKGQRGRKSPFVTLSVSPPYTVSGFYAWPAGIGSRLFRCGKRACLAPNTHCACHTVLNVGVKNGVPPKKISWRLLYTFMELKTRDRAILDFSRLTSQSVQDPTRLLSSSISFLPQGSLHHS